MTLFREYSIIPSAPASCSKGIKSLTMLPLTTVSTAHHSPLHSPETVGAFREGSIQTTLSRFSLETFILRTTLPRAWSEPLSSTLICSIFFLFHGSRQASRLLISWG